jgi:hypothetical protein
MPITTPSPVIDPRPHSVAGAVTVGTGAHAPPQRCSRPSAGPIPPSASFELAWTRILAAYDILHQAGIACPSEAAMLRRLRAAARRILAAAPASHAECWLVPATPRDVTACHLVAVSLLRHGRLVRLWPWPAPAPGTAMTVGANWRTLLQRPDAQRSDDAGMAESA